jgi:hypothetical protein
MTAAAQRVAQEQSDAVLDEIEGCLDRIDCLSPGVCSALQTTAAAMLAEDGCTGRYSHALSRLLEALAASAEAAASAQGHAPGGGVVAAPQTEGRAGIAAARALQAAVSGASLADGAAA